VVVDLRSWRRRRRTGVAVILVILVASVTVILVASVTVIVLVLAVIGLVLAVIVTLAEARPRVLSNSEPVMQFLFDEF
jgi:peptidoglycan/LPS O-acetylase OafA/YrhL